MAGAADRAVTALLQAAEALRLPEAFHTARGLRLYDGQQYEGVQPLLAAHRASALAALRRAAAALDAWPADFLPRATAVEVLGRAAAYDVYGYSVSSAAEGDLGQNSVVPDPLEWTDAECAAEARRVVESAVRLCPVPEEAAAARHTAEEAAVGGLLPAFVSWLRPRMRAGGDGKAWKQHAEARYVVWWLMSRARHPFLNGHVGALLPLVLPLLDDFEAHNKIIGARSLLCVVRQANATEVRWHSSLLVHSLSRCVAPRRRRSDAASAGPGYRVSTDRPAPTAGSAPTGWRGRRRDRAARSPPREGRTTGPPRSPPDRLPGADPAGAPGRAFLRNRSCSRPGDPAPAGLHIGGDLLA